MALVDRTSDANYYYTDPDSESMDYTIDRKSSIAEDIRSRNIVYCISEFDRIPSRYATKYYHALLLTDSGTAYATLRAKMASKESDTRATNAAAVKAAVARSVDWVN